ncbi:MAG: hypothetical protein C0507_18550 [Cyanobacteria bacterium PR.3.49]|nr:hypothetical protein [Cyanobacteria bacterium PR.3.49]
MWKIAIVFLLVFVNFGYWYWTTTPFYSILEIREAIVHHDLRSFEQYVDVERVSSNMIDGFLTPQVRSRLSKGVLGEMLGSSLISLVKPTLMDIIKNEVSHFVESNQLAVNQGAGRITKGRKRKDNATAPAIGRVLKVTKTKDGKVVVQEVPLDSVPAAQRPAALAAARGQSVEEHPQTALAKPANLTQSTGLDTGDMNDESPSEKESKSKGGFGLSDLSMKNVTGKLGFGKQAFKKIAFVRVRKNDATIGVMLHNKRYDTDMLLELKMERQDEHWRLVEVSNFSSFVYLIVSYEQARRDRSS